MVRGTFSISSETFELVKLIEIGATPNQRGFLSALKTAKPGLRRSE
jgi:hypothetical protein